MFFGIIALSLVGLSWLLWGIVMGRAPKDGVDVGSLLFLTAATTFLISVGAGLFQELPADLKTTGAVFLCLFACGIVNNLQLVVLAKAMQMGPNGVIWSLTQSGFVIPFLMGVLIFHTDASGIRWSGFLSIILSLLLLGFAKEDNGQNQTGWRFFTFLAFIITGVSQSLSNLPSYIPDAMAVSTIWKTAFFGLGLAAGTPICRACDGSWNTFLPKLREAILSRRVWYYCLLMQIFSLAANWFLLYKGMDSLAAAGAGAIAYPLMVGACLIGFEGYSILILREKRSALQLLMLVLCLLGVVALAF